MIDPFEFLATTNFRDLRGHCRCYFFDRGMPCSFTPCFLYHQGRDCPEFAAKGSCERGAECTLEHSEQRYTYGKRMPMRSDITAEIRQVWQDAQQFTFDANVALDSPAMSAVWTEIKAIDKDNGPPYLQKMSESIVKLMKLCPSNPLQTLERLFRKNDINTWIIARKEPLFDVKELSTRQFGRPDALALDIKDVHGNQQPFYFFLSSRQTHLAIGELLEESSSYRENFDKLATCGTVVMRETD